MRGLDFDLLGGALMLLALLLAGCGPNALQVHVDVARAMHDAQAEAEPLIRDARTRAMVAEAQRVHDAGGDQEAAEGAADAEASRWTCAIEGHRMFGLAVNAYVGEIGLAASAAPDGDLLGRLLPYALKGLDTWRLLASCVGSLSPGLIPEAPSFLRMFPPEWRGGGTP